MSLGRDVVTLRLARDHLAAQVRAGADTHSATLGEAKGELARTEAALAAAEREAREAPECAHLFVAKRGGRRPTTTASVKTVPSTQGEDMPKKSKAQQLEETLEALRLAEKKAGSTKWALSGKGAEKNPPSKERRAALEEKLAGHQAEIAELRARRDELKQKTAA